MKTNPNESASPITTVIDGNWIQEPPENRKGLTKREYFAAIAMQGLLAYDGLIPHRYNMDRAVRMADNLIESLNKET